jgi:ABC-type dipeptide/oligopeptide/nickel transport system permease component
MFRYLQTSTFILLWCFALIVVWSVVCFYWFILRQKSLPTWGMQPTLLPSLILGPLVLIGFYQLFNINLIFPVQLMASLGDIILASLLPAIILLLASGLMFYVFQTTAREVRHWRQKPFVALTLAKGGTESMALRKLVILKSLAEGWSQCLPWLFGELIIVEAMFNAPGLGLDTWNMAKMRNMEGLFQSLLWLGGIYLLSFWLTVRWNRWIGNRLEGYA